MGAKEVDSLKPCIAEICEHETKQTAVINHITLKAHGKKDASHASMLSTQKAGLYGPAFCVT